MPRVNKECYDWSLTWSPEEDVTDMPEFFRQWMEHSNIRRCVAILERHTAEDKWHMHIGFTYYRSYKSDYKWWKDALKGAGFEEPGLCIKYHDNILGLVGGYCSKADEGDRRVLFTKGFTNEQLEYGKQLYIKGQRRQRVRKFLDSHLVINAAKVEAAVGAMQAELECDEKTAVYHLVDDGWCFSNSIKGYSQVYQIKYLERQLQELQDGTEGV